MKQRKIHTSDKLEIDVIDILNSKSVSFIHESEEGFPRKGNRTLDFYLPYFDIYIEVKANHTDRLYDQIKQYEDLSNPNIIVVIGKSGVDFLKALTEI